MCDSLPFVFGAQMCRAGANLIDHVRVTCTWDSSLFLAKRHLGNCRLRVRKIKVPHKKSASLLVRTQQCIALIIHDVAMKVFDLLIGCYSALLSRIFCTLQCLIRTHRPSPPKRLKLRGSFPSSCHFKPIEMDCFTTLDGPTKCSP